MFYTFCPLSRPKNVPAPLPKGFAAGSVVLKHDARRKPHRKEPQLYINEVAEGCRIVVVK